jgi:hypothetical protein
MATDQRHAEMTECLLENTMRFIAADITLFFENSAGVSRV